MTRDTETDILNASAELFAERGYAATTTRAIAERAGVNEVTLFRRFESKAGVLRALGERWAQTMAGVVVPSMPDPSDTHATIATLARMEIEGAVRDGGVAMRLAFDARTVPEVAELMDGGPGANLDGLAEYLASRQQAGDLRSDIDARLMAEAFFNITSTMVMARQLLGHSGSPEELAERRDGLAARGVVLERSEGREAMRGDTMKTLVVYGTKSGCTEGIAQRIGERIAAGGSSVEVFPAEKAPDPSAYDAVVVGSGVRAGSWHAPVKRWVEANAQALKSRPVAFYTCGLMITQEGKADEVRAYTDPIIAATGITPVDIGLFAGSFRPKEFPFAERTILKLMKTPEGDFRDWDEIDAWADEITPALSA